MYTNLGKQYFEEKKEQQNSPQTDKMQDCAIFQNNLNLIIFNMSYHLIVRIS